VVGDEHAEAGCYSLTGSGQAWRGVTIVRVAVKAWLPAIAPRWQSTLEEGNCRRNGREWQKQQIPRITSGRQSNGR